MKKIFNTFITLLLVFFIFSCNRTNDDTNIQAIYINVNDSEGEKNIKLNPTNVAMLYPSFGDIWNITGGSINIGVEDLITRGYANCDITIVGSGTGKNIDIEALVASKPDLTILCSDFPNHITIAKSLKEYKMPYVIFDFSSFEDYLFILNVFSKINACSDIYNQYGTLIENKINSVIASTIVKEAKRVLLLRATSTFVKALDKTNFVGDMILKLGSINIADTNNELTTALSMESIIKLDPEVILVVPMGDEDIVFEVAKNELAKDTWKSITAIKNNNVYYMEKNLFHYKPNLRWGDAYEILAQRIYNE